MVFRTEPPLVIQGLYQYIQYGWYILYKPSHNFPIFHIIDYWYNHLILLEGTPSLSLIVDCIPYHSPWTSYSFTIIFQLPFSNQILGHFHTTPMFQVPFSDPTTEVVAVLRAACLLRHWSWSGTSKPGVHRCGWDMNMWLAGKSPMNKYGKAGNEHRGQMLGNVPNMNKHEFFLIWTNRKMWQTWLEMEIFIDKHWFIIYEIWLWKICDNHGQLMENSTPKNGGVTWFITGNIHYNQCIYI